MPAMVPPFWGCGERVLTTLHKRCAEALLSVCYDGFLYLLVPRNALQFFCGVCLFSALWCISYQEGQFYLGVLLDSSTGANIGSIAYGNEALVPARLAVGGCR